jgi:hypothetical protein
MTFDAEEEGQFKSPSDVKITLATIGLGLIILVAAILVGM